MFPSPRRNDSPVSTSHAWHVVRGVLLRAGLTHGHPHTFRHTFVHMLSTMGVSLDLIARLLGHRHATLTAGVYNRTGVPTK